VASRLLEFLETNREFAQPVVEVWRNVEIRRQAAPAAAFAEYDVCLLLRNASLISLECKTHFKVQEKDLYSRLAKLRVAGGEGALQVICGPLFTALAGTPEFLRQHLLRQRCRDLGLAFLAYTGDNQPGRYDIGDGEVQVDSFEKGLQALLGPFRSQS